MCFFFFKQKTAYEMRISDWSSDVCSSDLQRGASVRGAGAGAGGAVQLVAAGRRDVQGGAFPFRLGRQARARPSGIGVRLIEADMADRRGGIDRLAPVQAEACPALLAPPPVKRRLYPFGLHPGPAVRQPKGRGGLAPPPRA